MHDLTSLLESIPTNSCDNREDAKRDLSSGISMGSSVVIEEFMKSWIDITDHELHNLSQHDAQYRDFLLEFKEKYNAN